MARAAAHARSSSAGVVPSDAPPAFDHRWWTAVALLTLLAACLRVLLLDAKSLWLDEAFSVHLAREPADAFWSQLSRREANGALYFVLLRVWLALGEGETVVRAFSVLAAVGTVPVVAVLGRRLLGAPAGLTAALLLAVHATHVRHAQTARGYALVILLVSLATLLFARALERPSPARWAVYAVAAVAAVYAHFFAALVLAAHVVSLGFRPSRTVPGAALLGAMAAVAVGALPLAVFVAFRQGGQIAWVSAPGPPDLAFAAWTLAGAGPELLAYVPLASLGVVGGLATWRRLGRSAGAWRAALPVLWLVVPWAIALLVSVWQPVFVERYLSVCLPALVLVSAAGVERLRAAGARLAAVAAIVFLAGCGLALHYRPALAVPLVRGSGLEPILSGVVPVDRLLDQPPRPGWLGDLLRLHLSREDWRSATLFVLATAETGEALVFVPPYVRRPFDYYRRRLDRTEAAPVTVFPSDSYGERWPAADLGERLARGHTGVWVVLSHERTSERDLATADRLVREELPLRFSRHHEVAFDGIRVHRFTAASAEPAPASAPP